MTFGGTGRLLHTHIRNRHTFTDAEIVNVSTLGLRHTKLHNRLGHTLVFKLT